MLGELDKMVVRYGAYIAILEQGLNELREAHNKATARIAELEAELAPKDHTVKQPAK